MPPRTLLDSETFSLDLPGASGLYQLLCRSLPNSFAATPILTPILVRIGIEPAAIGWATMTDVWVAVLEQAAQMRKLRDLVDQLCDLPQFDAALATFVAKLPDLGDEVPAVGGEGPFGAWVLGSRRPFIDREPIREALAELATDAGPRVLVVDGPPGSGRSYLWFLIAHALGGLGQTRGRPARIQPSAWTEPEPWGPLDLMVAVADELGWPLPEVDATAQPDTQVRLLGRWFRSKAQDEPTPRWLVLDDLHPAHLTAAGLRMAAEVANSIGQAQAGEFRVVLLGYQGTLSTEVDPYAARESIAHLDVAALRDYFRAVAAWAGAELADDDADLVVERAAGPPPHPHPLELGLLGPRIAEAARLLVAGHPGG